MTSLSTSKPSTSYEFTCTVIPKGPLAGLALNGNSIKPIENYPDQYGFLNCILCGIRRYSDQEWNKKTINLSNSTDLHENKLLCQICSLSENQKIVKSGKPGNDLHKFFSNRPAVFQLTGYPIYDCPPSDSTNTEKKSSYSDLNFS